MYPRRSVPLDVQSDIYVKDPVLFCAKQRGTLFYISQVMIPHTLICKIYVLRLTTLVCNELRYSLLDYEAGNSYLLL